MTPLPRPVNARPPTKSVLQTLRTALDVYEEECGPSSASHEARVWVAQWQAVDNKAVSEYDRS